MKIKNNKSLIIWILSLIFCSTMLLQADVSVELNADIQNKQFKIIEIDSIITPDIIQINWYLSASTAPLEFEVERSQNRIQYDKIDQVRRTMLDSQTVKYTYYDFRPPAGRYFYRLKYSHDKFEDQYSKPISINMSNLKQTFLDQNTSQTRYAVNSIGFNIQKPEKVNLCIFNMFGQLVKNLIDDVINTGHYRISWDGLDNSGLVVPGGIYFYQIMIGQHTETRRIQFVR